MADAPAPTFNKPKPKNQRYLLIGGLAAGGVVGYVWYERRKNAGSTASQSSSSAIDPNTGIPYADEQNFVGPVGTSPGALGTYNPVTGQYIPGLGSTIPSASVPASNAQWASAAEATLLGDNFDPNSTAVALGLYLSGQPLTPDQYNTVQAAIGFSGNPPVSVPSPILIRGGGVGNSGNGSTGSGQTNSAPQPGPMTGISWDVLGIANPGSQAGGNMTLGQLLDTLSSQGYSLNNLTIGGTPYNVPTTGAFASPNHVGSQYLSSRVISATPYNNRLVNVAI